MQKHLTITISGKVQNVGFRFAAILEAQSLGLVGFVKNQGDGVYIEAQGEIEQLKQFLKWCHEGPKGARVEKVDYISGEELKNFKDFTGE